MGGAGPGCGLAGSRDGVDYQLDEKTDCFQVFPSWTGNEPRKSVDWAYVDPDSTADTRPCAYTEENKAGPRDCAGEHGHQKTGEF